MAFGFIGDAYNAVAGKTDVHRGEGPQRQARQSQRAVGGRLYDMAFNGTGPSSAQALVDRNRSQNAAQQVGMAKTLGGDPALANRLAAEGIAKGNAEASYQGALIRNQEQQQAMQSYLQNLAAMRGQDVNVYGQQLQANQQNTANEKEFIGGLINKGASAIGGMF